MHRIFAFAVVAVALASAVPSSHAVVLIFTAALDGPSESPPNASPGTGFARVDFDTLAHELTVEASFEGLIGPTTAAHIHAPTAVPGTGTIGVATMLPTFAGFPLGVTSGDYGPIVFATLVLDTYNPAFVTANGGTAAGAEAALIASLLAGTAYFNIHSTAFPGGEIRGFLQQVPEPASFVIWGLGALALVGYGGWRRRATRSV